MYENNNNIIITFRCIAYILYVYTRVDHPDTSPPSQVSHQPGGVDTGPMCNIMENPCFDFSFIFQPRDTVDTIVRT